MSAKVCFSINLNVYGRNVLIIILSDPAKSREDEILRLKHGKHATIIKRSNIDFNYHYYWS